MKREQIDNKYKWNKEDIFKSEDDFYSLLKETEKQMGRVVIGNRRNLPFRGVFRWQVVG